MPEKVLKPNNNWCWGKSIDHISTTETFS
jgi:hypothetical protein